MRKYFYMWLLLGLSTACTKQPVITVTNTTDIDRENEIVQLSPVPEALKGCDKSIVDEKGAEVPYQITYDSILIFPATVAANATATYTIKDVAPSPADTLMAWTMRPDLQDDVAWENEHAGYRLYGPNFKRGGGKVHGYDIWCKRSDTPIVDKLYDNNRDGLTYHKDHGEGFDGYTVGPTFGAGGCALLGSEGPCYATAYDSYEVLDKGPLRISIRFTLDSIDYDGTPVKETRTVSLDRNARFNKVSTRYDGVPDTAWVATGIVVHSDNPEGYDILNEANGISVVDLSDDLNAGNGEIYVGAIVPDASEITYMPFYKETARATGQVVARQQLKGGEPFIYYWGSGWNKHSVADAGEWQKIIKDSRKALDSPMSVNFSNE